jgi:small subunit ribosomal protein S18
MADGRDGRDSRDRDGRDGREGREGREGRGRRKWPGGGKDLVLDYKNPQLLRNFVSDRGKIVPARVSGLCAAKQRALTRAVKRARILALLPYKVK